MKALRAFDYSHDGIKAIHLKPGDDASDVPESAVKALIKEGYIGKADAKVKTKAIEAAPETGAAEKLEGAADEGAKDDVE